MRGRGRARLDAQSLQQKFHSLPMNGRDDFQGENAVPRHDAKQRGVGQDAAAPGKGRCDRGSVGVAGVDDKGGGFAGRRDLEIVGHRHRHEWGNIECFVAALPYDRRRGIGYRDEVGMPLTEGVVHLVQHRDKGFVAAVAEPDGDGVEHAAQHTRHAQHPDRPAVGR